MVRDEIGGVGGGQHLLPVFIEEMELKEDEAKELYDAMSYIIAKALYTNEVSGMRR